MLMCTLKYCVGVSFAKDSFPFAFKVCGILRNVAQNSWRNFYVCVRLKLYLVGKHRMMKASFYIWWHLRLASSFIDIVKRTISISFSPCNCSIEIFITLQHVSECQRFLLLILFTRWRWNTPAEIYEQARKFVIWLIVVSVIKLDWLSVCDTLNGLSFVFEWTTHELNEVTDNLIQTDKTTVSRRWQILPQNWNYSFAQNHSQQ